MQQTQTESENVDEIFLHFFIRRHDLFSLAISKRFELEVCAW
jgi:hypothetical protein